ncbi:hypothetical protein [Ectorhizobium quercum]|uniref:hypothetical protein n=1 Tax=Ectorhizobium quercum TaxID=2965071 RepID=UPI0027951F93|nr:hypothetical protein [Ectorhizobium quercum]
MVCTDFDSQALPAKTVQKACGTSSGLTKQRDRALFRAVLLLRRRPFGLARALLVKSGID